MSYCLHMVGGCLLGMLVLTPTALGRGAGSGLVHQLSARVARSLPLGIERGTSRRPSAAVLDAGITFDGARFIARHGS